MKAQNLTVLGVLQGLIFGVFFGAFCCADLSAKEWTAIELIDKSNELLRGQSSRAVIVMHIQTESWNRTLKIEAWNQGRNKAMMRIHQPAKERGNGTLKISKELWNWLPAVERIIKIPPSMMQSSWMGSDFTYNDVVKADSIVQDYTHKIIGQERKGGFTHYLIEATPKPDAPVVWGKVMTEVKADDQGVLPVKEEDFSERGEHMRTIEFSEDKILGGRRIPTVLTCTPHRKQGHKTTMTYQEFDVDLPFDANFFSLRNLQKPIK